MVIDDLAKVAEMVRCKGSLENKQIIKERTISELIDYNNDYNWPSIEKEIYFLMAHIVQNGIKQALRIKNIC